MAEESKTSEQGSQEAVKMAVERAKNVKLAVKSEEAVKMAVTRAAQKAENRGRGDGKTVTMAVQRAENDGSGYL